MEGHPAHARALGRQLEPSVQVARLERLPVLGGEDVVALARPQRREPVGRQLTRERRGDRDLTPPAAALGRPGLPVANTALNVQAPLGEVEVEVAPL